MALQVIETEKRDTQITNGNKDLEASNKELVHQNQEKLKRYDKLVIAIKELTFQNQEKEKRVKELIIANMRI